MQVIAKLKYFRMAPKKIRLVVDVIRGMKVDEALVQLNFMNKLAAKSVIKLINSAISNAENNFELKRDNLFIKEIKVDGAGMLKRWMPRAHGRATPIRKRNSHILIVLDELVPTEPKAKKKDKKADKPVRLASLDEAKKLPEPQKANQAKLKVTKSENEDKKEVHDARMEGKHRHNQHSDKRNMKGKKGFINKIFNRKAG